MQNLLLDKRLCYLPSAEHQHIREGLSFEELLTKVRWMLRLRWLERCALPVSCQSSRTAVTNCSIICCYLLLLLVCLPVEDAEGDEVVQSGKPLFSEAGRLQIIGRLGRYHRHFLTLCPARSVCSASEMQIIREISEETKVYFKLMTKLRRYSLSIQSQC